MCYYAEWDERFQQAAKEIRKSKEETDLLMKLAKEAANARLVHSPDESAEQPAGSRDEVTA